jgi:hypothetical protein
LLAAPEAFAVPAAFWVVQALPVVPSNPTEPGLCHGCLLGQEPCRLLPDEEERARTAAGQLHAVGIRRY